MPEAAFAALLPVETEGPEETRTLGARLAHALAPGDVVALYGDLGTGKTHLVQGICVALGVPRHAVTSPTFTLVHEYASGSFPLYHLDAYRIRDVNEFFELGYEDYFYGDGVCLVEWPARVEPLLPACTIRVGLAHRGGDRRCISLVQRDDQR